MSPANLSTCCEGQATRALASLPEYLVGGCDNCGVVCLLDLLVSCLCNHEVSCLFNHEVSCLFNHEVSCLSNYEVSCLSNHELRDLCRLSYTHTRTYTHVMASQRGFVLFTGPHACMRALMYAHTVRACCVFYLVTG